MRHSPGHLRPFHGMGHRHRAPPDQGRLIFEHRIGLACREPTYPINCFTMEQTDWPTRLAHRIAGEVRRYRTMRGISAQQLSDLCSAVGMDIPRAVISNLENGRRTSVTVAEVLVLAAALDVPPLLLVFPVGYEEVCEVLPDRRRDTWGGFLWAAGDRDTKGSALPIRGDLENFDNASSTLYRTFYETVEQVSAFMFRAIEDEDRARKTQNEKVRKSLVDSARLHRMMARDVYSELRETADVMAEHGIAVPHLHTYDAVFADLAKEYE
ncbi:helix-turn-helix domain-containing protein [Streptomyces sp. 8N616]|uniref:helix-turn-helix domain-containing protein n=1 Tax=Streptomyces sp. 8N616 TaxID=3457414 RepID=UPI003FD51567